MFRTLTGAATTAVALVALPATAAGVLIVDVDPEDTSRLELKRAIVDHVQERYGETVVYEDPDELPDSVNRQIVPGNTLPESAIAPLPEGIDELPHMQEGSRWVRAGNHLVEITDDRMIVTAVYDVLG